MHEGVATASDRKDFCSGSGAIKPSRRETKRGKGGGGGGGRCRATRPSSLGLRSNIARKTCPAKCTRSKPTQHRTARLLPISSELQCPGQHTLSNVVTVPAWPLFAACMSRGPPHQKDCKATPNEQQATRIPREDWRRGGGGGGG